MKIAVHLARHRRLLALGGLSLLLHLLALVWIGGRSERSARADLGAPIALRLAQSAAAPRAAAPEPTALPAPAPAPTTAPAPPADAPAGEAAASAPAAMPPLQPLLPAAPDGAPAPAAAQAAPPPSGDPRGARTLAMPGRYLVRMPPSAHLTYTLTRSRPGAAAAKDGEAQLVWEADNGHYQMRLEGVLGLLESEGGADDAGIAPLQASAHQEDGSDQVTRFDRAAGRIESDDMRADPRSDPLHLGSQDRASLLMQLAGMGLAQPEQMQGVIEVMVGGPDGAQVARFQVLGREQIATGAGSLATVRLAGLNDPGQPKLELWLAPERNWMPVQLRVTAPDGSVANQLLSAISLQAPPGADVM